MELMVPILILAFIFILLTRLIKGIIKFWLSLLLFFLLLCVL